METEKIQQYLDKGIEMAIEYGPKVLLALATLVIGFWVAGKVSHLVGKALNRRAVDDSVRPFLTSVVNVLLKVLVMISVAEIIGVETTSFVAIMGAATLAIGMALQGSLGNFAGGVLVLTFRPYRVGDLITAQGHTGVVKSIQVFNTVLLTPDNKTVILPNGAVSNGDITNLSTHGNLRVDLVIGISYGADIKKARQVAMQVMQDDPKVLNDPAPSVNVLELAESSVNLAVRPYATVADYWDVYFGIQEKVKLAFDQSGIAIPFPQVDVHMISK
ncbi:MAG: mechanosensitive ion channel [Bacteroidia bacterium]|nr:mechanosensitive ion channel [Bacteroidia bacterium]